MESPRLHFCAALGPKTFAGVTRFNLENAIATWRRQFRFNRAFLDQDIDELEWHVRDQVSALVARGNSEREAFQTAVNEMGLSVDAAGEYRKVFWTKLLDQRALMAELRWRASMLSNYLKLAYRNLSKNPGSSIINIVGLSVAVAATIVVYLFLQLNLTMDAFHENADRIYMVGSISERDGSTRRSDRAPMPLGALLESDFPQVEQAVRVENGGQVTVKLGDIAQEEALWFVDPGFLELFTFPLSVGDPGALTDKDAIILSADAAERFFGSEPALGRPLVITFNQSHTRTFMVRGVAEPLPDNASFRFNLLVNFELGQELGGDALDDWRGNALATFVLLRRGADSRDIESAMLPYQRLQNAANEVWPITEFTFTNLRDVAQNAHKASVSIARASNPATLIIFPLIALFLIALSCLNYVNIAMSQALRRVREIGLRKVLGGTRPQLIAQFLAENVLLSLMALVLGGVFASLVLLPGFNALFEDAAPLSLLLSDNGALWATLATILLVTGLLAGAFPALRLAAGNPAVVLSGNRRSKREGSWFASGLLGIQFVVAFTSMTAGLVFYQNAQYQTARDWGYSQEQTLVIRLSRDGQFEALADKFSANANANVLSLSGSIHH
ncbi:MAG: putative ABC transport system permease protein, partial [Thalassolituus oleivorans]